MIDSRIDGERQGYPAVDGEAYFHRARCGATSYIRSILICPVDQRNGPSDMAARVFYWIIRTARQLLKNRLPSGNCHSKLRESRWEFASYPPPSEVEFAAHHGRISSPELASLTHNPKSGGNMGRVLRELEDEGILVPSRANRAGPGFHYRYVP